MLSTTSQYALRALCHLARQSEEAVLGRDLAHSVEIPANYLSKLLVTLRNAGLVETSRGLGGGYRLRRPANEIQLINVVELFEEIPRIGSPCFLDRTRTCSETTPCTAHSRWQGVQAAYLGFLNSTPLSAIAGTPDDSWTTSFGGGACRTGSRQSDKSTHNGG
jgi:Rrf2 family protein